MIYWLTFKIKDHPQYPVTHSFPLALGVYFDKDGDTFDKNEGYTEGPLTGKNKHVTAGLSMPYVKGKTEYHLMISEEQFNASNPLVYIWMEPYGAAALRHAEYMDGSLVGRLELDASHMNPNKGALSLRPPSSQPDDKQMVFEFEIGDSVVQYIVNEMNTNKNSRTVNAIREIRNSPYLTEQQRQQRSEELFGRAVHANGADKGAWAQDIYFMGGGEWDHKPIIEPPGKDASAAWGALNRLGNSGYVYKYDVWSNLHYGYIAAAGGIPLVRALGAAGLAQTIDTNGTAWEKASTTAGILWNPPSRRSDAELMSHMSKDEPEDSRAIVAGYGLWDKTVTRQMVLIIISQHDGWLAVP